METLGQGALLVAAPEVGIPLEVGKQLAPHASTILMIPLVMFSILLIIVAIIVLSAAKSKTPGYLLLLLGFLTGGGAFYVMARSEGKKTR
jgi:hypothetical protein